jgi:arylsulfatase A-like enzyme
MIRTDDWKYVHRFPYGPHELYDLVHDPGERVNLVEEPAHADRRAALERQLRAWFLTYVNPEIDGVREPVTGKGQLARAGAGARAFAPVTVD